MGADLYIDSVQKIKTLWYEKSYHEAIRMRDSRNPPYNAEYHEQAEYLFHKMYRVGYFRDSYNTSNLLWRFDLSYWSNDLKLNDDGDLPPSEAKRLLEMLKEREPIFEYSLERIRSEGWAEEPEIVINYFRMKYLRLRVFLRLAIRLNETIIWSV